MIIYKDTDNKERLYMENETELKNIVSYCYNINKNRGIDNYENIQDYLDKNNGLIYIDRMNIFYPNSKNYIKNYIRTNLIERMLG